MPGEWLLQPKGVKAFIYVVAGGAGGGAGGGDRVVGALFAEPIRRAFRTLPSAGAAVPVSEVGDGTAAEGNVVASGSKGPRRHAAEEDGSGGAGTGGGGSGGGQAEEAAGACGKAGTAVAPSTTTASAAAAAAAGHPPLPDTRGVLLRGAAPERAVCGVRGVWVHPGHRRRGVATALLAAARHGLVPGYVAGADECAFTQPTEAGRSLALGLAPDAATFLVY